MDLSFVCSDMSELLVRIGLFIIGLLIGGAAVLALYVEATRTNKDPSPAPVPLKCMPDEGVLPKRVYILFVKYAYGHHGLCDTQGGIEGVFTDRNIADSEGKRLCNTYKDMFTWYEINEQYIEVSK